MLTSKNVISISSFSSLQTIPSPVFVFDLDQTLINNCPRTVAIFREFANHADTVLEFRDAFKNISEKHYEFSIVKMLLNAGIDQQEVISTALKFWMRRFFSNEYLYLDTPIAGAIEYVKAVYKKGGVIVYLTARDKNNMEEGTIRSLQHIGFPLDDSQAFLFMKQDVQQYDHESKRLHLEAIEQLGSVFAVFENDPKNLRIIIERFQNAIPVFMTTGHLEGMGDPPASSIFLNDFLELL